MPLSKLAGRSALVLILAGAASTAAIADETVTYTYDALGRLVVVRSAGTVNDSQTASYCYDAAGNRTLVKTHSSGLAADCPAATPPPTPAPSITIGNASATEGASMQFTVSLSQAHTSSISVNYATAYGTAGSSDFTATSGTLTFSAGQTSKSISVSTIQDIQLEATETFTVNLSGATGGATISDSQGAGTIYDDDEDPTCGEYLC